MTLEAFFLTNWSKTFPLSQLSIFRSSPSFSSHLPPLPPSFFPLLPSLQAGIIYSIPILVGWRCVSFRHNSSPEGRRCKSSTVWYQGEETGFAPRNKTFYSLTQFPKIQALRASFSFQIKLQIEQNLAIYRRGTYTLHFTQCTSECNYEGHDSCSSMWATYGMTKSKWLTHYIYLGNDWGFLQFMLTYVA